MNRRLVKKWAWVCAMAGLAASAEVDFDTDIRPILSDKCYFCHGPDAADIKGKLQLHTYEAATSDRKGRGAAIVPGKPEESLLWQRVTTTDPDEVMPPPKRHMAITPAEQEKLRQWIVDGAEYQELWSFEPLPKTVPVPEVQGSQIRNEVDRYVQAKLAKVGLKPAPQAEPELLLRRVHLALTGLVPTPEEVAAFTADPSDAAYEAVVDKLLASQAAAEHLAVDWMDVARYADSYGYQRDNGRNVTPWRDWALRAFRDNMPYDQFIMQQLAGDLMPDADDDKILATAFNRLHGMKVEGGSIDEEFRTEYVADRVQTAGTAFLGLTMECCRCHDHKYDPISMKDYYRTFAIFNNIDESGLLAYFDTSVPSPTLIMTNDGEKAELAKRLEARDVAEKGYREACEAERPAFAEWRKSWDGKIQPAGLLAGYSFDQIAGNRAPSDLYRQTAESDADGGKIEINGRIYTLTHPKAGKTPVREINIQLPGEERILSVAELEIWSNGENLTKTATLAQSSEYGSFPVTLLADGNYDNFTHTATETDPWISVKLAKPSTIENVKIWNRAGLESRFDGARISLLGEDAGGEPICEMTLEIDGSSGGGIAVAGTLVDGISGQGVQFDGDTTMGLGNVGPFARHAPFTYSLAIKSSAHHKRAVILHRSRAWSDSGSRGYELLMIDGKLEAALVHFWPGNQIRIRTRNQIPVDAWTRVTVTYDGSGRAAGIRLFLNGELADTEIVRDHLTKEIRSGVGVAMAARFRDSGFKNSAVDEVAFFDRELTAAEVRTLHRADAKPASDDELFAYYLTTASEPAKAAFDKLTQARTAYNGYLDGRFRMMVMKEMEPRRKTYVLKRGLYSDPDYNQEVEPRPPEQIFPFGPEYPRNRLGFAQWLIHPEHPLTARVTVNRYWQMLFGEGIVATSNDFGFQGALPTHPQLLNHLARRFVDSGWDLRALLRHVVTSHTFRQDSAVSPELREKDPANHLLARGPSYHMTAEMLRDSAMYAGGWLHMHLGGGSVPLHSNRRSLYVSLARNSPPDEMITFGAGDRQVCMVKRESTSTPLQPLVLLNSPLYVRSARVLASVVLRPKEADDNARLNDLFLRLASRSPNDRELTILNAMLAEQRTYFESSPEVVQEFGKVSGAGRGANSELAAWTVVAGAVMNLDSFYMVR